MSGRTHRSLAFIGAAFLACATTATFAEESRHGAGPALEQGQVHTGPKLRGAELRRCVKLDFDLDAVDTEIRVLEGPLEAAQWSHELKARMLDADQPHLDHTDHAAVARYNERVAEHAEAVAAYNALLPAFNAVVRRQGEMVGRFNDACIERAYFKKEWWEEEARLYRERDAKP